MQRRYNRFLQQSDKGFTLVEVIIAMGILAMIAALSWRGLDALSRTRSASAKNSQHMHSLQIALAQWRADLAAALPDVGSQTSTPDNNNTIRIVPIDWNGNTLRIVRRASLTAANTASNNSVKLAPAHHTQPTELVSTATQIVAWSVHKNCPQHQTNSTTTSCWVRWQSPLLHSIGDQYSAWQQAAAWGAQTGNSQSAQVILPVTQWQIYFFYENEWAHPTSTVTGNSKTAWEKPEAIRLELDIAHAGNITLDWLAPTANRARD